MDLFIGGNGFFDRLPVEVRCLVSMMPLHSAIASARLRSILSAESQSWGLIPQGIVIQTASGYLLVYWYD